MFSSVTVRAASLLSAILLSSVQLCNAQSSSSVAPVQGVQGRFVNAASAAYNQRPAAYNQRPLRRYTGSQDYMYQTLALKSPVSPPFLPAYKAGGDTLYTGGVYYPKLKARQCYVMRYHAKATAYKVMSSYKDALLQNGWTINEMQSNDKQLTATKKDSGLYFTLCVYPSSKDEYRSSFEIKYMSAGAVQEHVM